MPSVKPRAGAYVDQETLDKFKVVASKNCRSVSHEIEFLMKEAIRHYELQHGPIHIDTKKQT